MPTFIPRVRLQQAEAIAKSQASPYVLRINSKGKPVLSALNTQGKLVNLKLQYYPRIDAYVVQAPKSGAIFPNQLASVFGRIIGANDLRRVIEHHVTKHTPYDWEQKKSALPAQQFERSSAARPNPAQTTGLPFAPPPDWANVGRSLPPLGTWVPQKRPSQPESAHNKAAVRPFVHAGTGTDAASVLPPQGTRVPQTRARPSQPQQSKDLPRPAPTQASRAPRLFAPKPLGANRAAIRAFVESDTAGIERILAPTQKQAVSVTAQGRSGATRQSAAVADQAPASTTLRAAGSAALLNDANGRQALKQELAIWEKSQSIDGKENLTATHVSTVIFNAFINGDRVSEISIGRQDGHTIRQLPDAIGQLRFLKKLEITGLGVVALPATIGHLSNLEELSLRDNPIQHLPDDISKLSNLRKLSLLRNELLDLPIGLGALQNLTELDASVNAITVLPESLSELRSLTKLRLDGNQISSLPTHLGNLQNLRSLSVESNKLRILPASIDNIAGLEELGLKGNAIEELPPGVAVYWGNRL